MEESDIKPIVPPSNDVDPVPPPYYMVQQQKPQPHFQPQYQPQPNVIVIIQPAYTLTTHVVGVPDHMGLAIFSCLCCFFWPLGLAAIDLSSQSKDALARGDVSSARANSNMSRWLSLASIGIGVIITIIVIIVVSTRTYRASFSNNYN